MLKTLNHLWRILATGFCFAMFGLGGVFLTLFVFPLQKLLIRDQDKKKQLARKTVHYTFKFFIGLMAWCRIFEFDLAKAQQLKALNGHLVLANHPSLIDVVVLISIIPNADCVVKAHLFKNPFLRGVVKNTGYISNADPEGLLVDCQASLAAGNNLIIFPEGTRTTPGKKLKFQRGAANIALRCNANENQPLQLTTVLLTLVPSTLTKSESWYQVPERKAQFAAEIMANEIEIPPLQPENVSKQVRELNNTLESFFLQASS
ncbi:lysophospholipid acyltransferase family protein [Litorilituus sediminis]|uniref:1-acyl-sn-glycerol-3-phosphate acyltransferase n=1 Tax=Litorilituus sediminis TaxID=718192 RepID=A0A4P6P5N4_9GAMM|nr:lysophospholipid acyltransferase family protein [Litorilituus sediminis]QBG36986.1 1-acyl-sn-glycerol-3-phosphate acyltransferase [Litorilituus sediminis]